MPKRQELTGKVLEKKRETDRASQRAVRARTKNYISHLEKLVETLQESQQDERVQRMARQCSRLVEENERLKAVVAGINRLTRSVDVPSTASGNPTIPPTTALTESVENYGVNTGSASNDDDFASFQSIPPCQSEDPQLQPLSFLPNQNLEPTSPVVPAEPLFSDIHSANQANKQASSIFQAQPQNLETSGRLHTADIAERVPIDGNCDINLFTVLNNILSNAQDLAVTSIEPERDADIAIRAIAYGWPEAERWHSLDPMWQILRQIDQTVFFSTGTVERLAILQILRLTLLHNGANSNQQQLQTLLPPYMLTRPAQKLVKHPTLFDYFVWPDLRDLLVLMAPTNISNLQATVFASSIRFLWPFDLWDTWTRNKHTGLHSFSSLFQERLRDIRCWTLTSDFFDSCPELTGYIPIYDPCPDFGI